MIDFFQPFRRRAKTFPRPRLSKPVIVIGDIHGRMDLLLQLRQTLESDPQTAGLRQVFVGDLIDRGPDSADVLKYLWQLAMKEDAPIICLKGNHEQMMLDFLRNPDASGKRWLDTGGIATLASYGIITHRYARLDDDVAQGLATRLRQAIPTEILNWLQDLPSRWNDGTLHVTHAGADPALQIDRQPEQNFIWGHPNFLRNPRRDGHWVAYGHFVQPEPEVLSGRIALDTGAWRNGILTAARVSSDGVVFIQAKDS